MRKEKLQLTDQHKAVVENAASDTTIRGTLLRGAEDKGGYACPRCKKKYSDEDKLRVHLASHGKVSDVISVTFISSRHRLIKIFRVYQLSVKI